MLRHAKATAIDVFVATAAGDAMQAGDICVSFL